MIDQTDLNVTVVVGIIMAVVILVLGVLVKLSTVSHVDKGALRQRLRSLLVVDDSKTIQKVVQLVFMDVCEVVEAAATAEDGLRLLEMRSFDLVFADIHLGGDVPGYEICRRAKAQRPDRPVVMLLGTFEPIDKREYEECGADVLVRKPFDGNELLEVASRLMIPAPG